ncbi:MAG: PAS domain S-box protein [bacterium]|nr:PAS domain S-box protein [bacterium]
MHFPDIRTILLTTLVIESICVWLIALQWRRNRKRYPGLFFWVMNFLLEAVALFLVVLRGWIPDWASVVLSNVLALSGTLLLYIGLEVFTGKRSRQTHNVLLIGVFSVVHVWFTYARPDLAARDLNLSIVWLIIGLQGVLLLMRRVDAPMRGMTRGVGMVFGLFCLIHMVRIIQFFVSRETGQDLFTSGTFNSAVLFGYQLISILFLYTLMLMVQTRLQEDVEKQEEKFSKAFHSAPYGIMLTRLSDGLIFEVNEGFERMSGYRSSEVIGKTTLGLGVWVNESDRESVLRELSEKGMVLNREFQFKTATGGILTALFTTEPMILHGQKVLISTINDISERKRAETERETLIHDLYQALSKVKTLSGLLPICASCKKIRNDRGYWEHIELYISEHSEADFSHGICPECAERLYPEIFGEKKTTGGRTKREHGKN